MNNKGERSKNNFILKEDFKIPLIQVKLIKERQNLRLGAKVE